MRVLRNPLTLLRPAGLLTLTVCLANCGSDGQSSLPPGSNSSPLPPAVAHAQADGTAPDPALVTADNQLGLNLLNTLSAGGTGNVSLSPVSLALALQIVYNGARGDAQTAMAQTLQLGSLTTEQVNSSNAALQASLDDLNPEVDLKIANSLWGHGGTAIFAPAFVQVSQTYYGAMLGSLDGPAGSLTGDPDAWVSNQTDGLITSIVQEPLSDILWLVANAVYFKGSWTTQFDPTQTVPAAFTRADGTQVTAQMMHLGAVEGYAKGAGFQALSLPYGKGRTRMLIILPDAGVDLGTLLAGLTAADLDALVKSEAQVQGGIALPRFTTRYQRSLVGALTTLGMGPALVDGDFSGIWAGGHLSAVCHAVYVKVDEEGTVAAAATGASQPTAVMANVFDMNMDHPFFYAIRDDDTGVLLFAGVMFDPTQP